MKPYTVVVLRPDYVTDNNPQEIYFTHVTAENPVQAGRMAREEAWFVDNDDKIANDDLREVEDYVVLVTLEGHHEDAAYKTYEN